MSKGKGSYQELHIINENVKTFINIISHTLLINSYMTMIVIKCLISYFRMCSYQSSIKILNNCGILAC